MNNKKARLFALYLPQFHPIPENDEWWGKGFTEWTNVGKAKPLFRGHQQPRVPADLGYYDLRLPEIREEQAKLAAEYGVESFMYWHYWFGNGRRILERPFNEVINSGRPDFPFCLGWANHSWSNATWLSNKQFDKKILIQQTYPGLDDIVDHFNSLLPAFKDVRYSKVNDKLVFLIYNPFEIPQIKLFFDTWNDLASKNGLNGFYFIGLSYFSKDIDRILALGFDAVNTIGMWEAGYKVRSFILTKLRTLFNRYLNGVVIDKSDYGKIIKHLYTKRDTEVNIIPSLIPRWDRTPRAGRYAGLYYNSTPQNFQKHLKMALDTIKDKPDENRILILRSWNEWAEGNYIEPDLDTGLQFLEVLKTEIFSK